MVRRRRSRTTRVRRTRRGKYVIRSKSGKRLICTCRPLRRSHRRRRRG